MAIVCINRVTMIAYNITVGTSVISQLSNYLNYRTSLLATLHDHTHMVLIDPETVATMLLGDHECIGDNKSSIEHIPG